MRATLTALAAVCVGCQPAPTEDTGLLLPPCEGEQTRSLQVAVYEGDYGEHTTGDPVMCGHPPQGGAPYAPFRLRITGLDGAAGLFVDMVATDTDTGAVLGSGSFEQRFTCANVGDDAGAYVGAELHMRFDGYDLEQLPGHEAEVEITVEDAEGQVLSTTLSGPLTLM